MLHVKSRNSQVEYNKRIMCKGSTYEGILSENKYTLICFIRLNFLLYFTKQLFSVPFNFLMSNCDNINRKCQQEKK